MPIAEKFAALGAGNGFPFCLEKVDVSDFDHVAPLTLEELMSFYWNTYKMTGLSEIDGLGGQLYSTSGATSTIDEPSDLICEMYGQQGFEDDFNSGRTRFRFSFYARRLYSGDTSDEENFIGYGFAFSLVDISPNGGAVPGGLSSEIKLYSYVNEQPESLDIKRDYATFSLSGAPFICEASANFRDRKPPPNEDDPYLVGTVNASQATASTQVVDPRGLTPSPISTKAILNEVEFYEY